jgi:hypothetical protein
MMFMTNNRSTAVTNPFGGNAVMSGEGKLILLRETVSVVFYPVTAAHTFESRLLIN